MQCDICNKKKATVHLTEIIDDQMSGIKYIEYYVLRIMFDNVDLLNVSTLLFDDMSYDNLFKIKGISITKKVFEYN